MKLVHTGISDVEKIDVFCMPYQEYVPFKFLLPI